MTQCRHGIVKGAGIRDDPVSAAHRSALRRARDDVCALFNRIVINPQNGVLLE